MTLTLIVEFSIEEVCNLMDYQDCMVLAYDLFFKNFFNDEIQNFAVHFFFAISQKFSVDWLSDWKNDVFLGKLCSITWRYDEMYVLYKRAYDSLSDRPDSLLLLLAGCHSAPGTPPINNETSEKYLRRAISKKTTYESCLMMKALAKNKNNIVEEMYWDRLCSESETKNIHTEVIIPNVLLERNKG